MTEPSMPVDLDALTRSFTAPGAACELAAVRCDPAGRQEALAAREDRR